MAHTVLPRAPSATSAIASWPQVARTNASTYGLSTNPPALWLVAVAFFPTIPSSKCTQHALISEFDGTHIIDQQYHVLVRRRQARIWLGVRIAQSVGPRSQ